MRSFPLPLVEITQSSIATFLTCKQKYVLRYLLKLVPNATAPALVIGTAFHKAMEIMLAPPATAEAKLSARQLEARRQPTVTMAINAIFDAALENGDAALNTDKLEYGRTQAHAIFAAWMIVNGTAWQTEVTVLQTEQTIRSCAKTICGALGDRLAGKIDGVVYDREGKTWLPEHKTRSASSGNFDFLIGLALNHQALFYAILYEEHAKRRPRSKVAIKMPSGFWYNVVVKPLHRTGATPAELQARMVQAMVESPDKYFSFTPVEFEQAAVDRARKHITRIIAEMDALTADTVTMNTTSCDDYGGCPYQALCRNGADTSDMTTLHNLPQLAGFHEVEPHIELSEEE